jgi:hypothetical protein
MCDISKAPPKQHAAPSSKPAAPHRPAAAQDAKKRAFTTLEDEDDGSYGVMYPQSIAQIGKAAPAFTTEGIAVAHMRRHPFLASITSHAVPSAIWAMTFTSSALYPALSGLIGSDFLYSTKLCIIVPFHVYNLALYECSCC